MSTFFRKAASGPRLSADEAARQGRVSKLAFEKLGQPDAIAFLNGHSDALGGRPIDLAVASAEGLAAVEAAIVAFKQA
jgi:hypothetical protein